MKFKYGLTQQEKDDITKRTILRQAKALYNACTDAYKLNSCKGCKFKDGFGCTLYGHPIEWRDKFR